MTSEHASSVESGAPDTVALARIVAHQRAELDRLRDRAATTAVLERAKGVLMARTGCSAEAAEDSLQRRAAAADRTLLEECWLLLGDLAAPAQPAPPQPAPGEPEEAPAPGQPPGEPPVEEPYPHLGRLGEALVRVRTPHDLARCLLEHLTDGTGADAVMIFSRLPSGGLELVGHAGVDATLAAQWRQVPPLSGVAALQALTTGEPLWLEDLETDRARYLLIGDPAHRWQSRAWLPITVPGSADVCVGVLRARPGPFTERSRERLRAVARLCAGRLGAFEPRVAPDADGTARTVQRLLDTLPGASLLLAPLRSPAGDIEDYRISAATEKAFDLLGRTGGDLVGLRLRECFPGLSDEQPLWRGCRHTLTTGEPYEGEPFAQQTVSEGVEELSLFSVRVGRLGDRLLLTWFRHGPSDRQEQRLADMQRLGNLGWAVWNLVTHEIVWSSQVYAALGRGPDRGPVRLTELPRLALPEDEPAVARAVADLVHHAQPCALPFRIAAPDGVRHLRFVAEAVTDLTGAPVEVHGFLQDVTAQRSAELALVERERAILTQHDVLRTERALAARLQHALLPLPTRPQHFSGLRVEITYLPAQSGIHVGGDWFSAIELPDGDALFVVGDVAGHGIDAVATMAQLRFTAKGMVITGSSLTGALARLNALLLHSRDTHATATMVLARYERRARRLVWAQAGHPPPLLLRDRDAVFLDRPDGMLLGASPAPRYGEAEVFLKPGDRLLFYTDGLVERPLESIDRGLRRLADAAVGHLADGPGLLGPLLTELLEEERRDDVCVVDVRVQDARDEPRDGQGERGEIEGP